MRSEPLDSIDVRILATLARDGRISKVDLAADIGLSPTPCAVRIEKLEAAGHIRGYHADLDIERLGNLSQFIVMASVRDSTPEKTAQFEAILAATPNIVSCDAVSGAADYMMRIFARNVRHYHETMAPFLAMEIDYTTYPVSKAVKDRTGLDLQQLLGVQY
ncbi:MULTISPECIES: Lrp/AsnC family transcriptional regulator [unclassified Sphingomonas]|uniref:Lrp/AsnC family transcriptional regulator n=1 Tax=unclassified Sphingomonas TaxID=196159 RepID=UPI002151D187|nr:MULTISPECIES: Lrp/AsnC family transcriptional regulator [unclassified Sphingomonas]MCR5872610.1 Lrp/AsnC family transcriptional regulator [Sphingomonas sp. J344]UUX99103.1 Lrp/AsnC family transcriptional regulator [Sphingomonas sp. J315]